MTSRQIKLWEQYALFAVVVLLIIYRAPYLFIEPRFWAEEGQTFFAKATCRSFWESLFFVQVQSGGYYNLIAAFATTLAANFVEIEWAPLVTTYIAFAIQLVPFIILIFGHSLVFNTTALKILAAMILLFSARDQGEAWLNSINSQVYCGLIAVMLLCENLKEASRIQISFYSLLMLIAGLTGPYAVFVGPAFFVKLYFERNRGCLFLFVVLSIAALIQVVVFLSLFHNHQLSAHKVNYFDETVFILNSFQFHVLQPLLGKTWASSVMRYVATVENQIAVGFVAKALFLIVILFAFSALLYKAKVSKTTYYLLTAFIVTALMTTFCAVGNHPHSRYSIVSNTTFLLLLLSVIVSYQKKSAIFILGTLVLLHSVGDGMAEYRKVFKPTDLLSWQDGVSRWRNKETDRVPVWPIKKWNAAPCRNKMISR